MTSRFMAVRLCRGGVSAYKGGGITVFVAPAYRGDPRSLSVESQSEKQDRWDDTWSEILRKAGVPNDQELTVADIDTACQQLHLYLFGHEWNQGDYPSPTALAKHPVVAKRTLEALFDQKEKLHQELLALNRVLSTAIRSYKQINFWPVPKKRREKAKQQHSSLGLLSVETLELRTLESAQAVLSACLDNIATWDKKLRKTKGKPWYVDEQPPRCACSRQVFYGENLRGLELSLCQPSAARCTVQGVPASPREVPSTGSDRMVNDIILDPFGALLNINRHSDLVELGLSKIPGPYTDNPWIAMPLPKRRLGTFMAYVTVERCLAGQDRLSDKEFVVLAILSKAWVMNKSFLTDLPDLLIEDVLERVQGAVVKARQRLLRSQQGA